MDRPHPNDTARRHIHDLEQWHELRAHIDAEIADGSTAWETRLPVLLDIVNDGDLRIVLRAHHVDGLDGVAHWLDKTWAWHCEDCGRPLRGGLDELLRPSGPGLKCTEGRGCDRQLALAEVG